MVPKLKFKKHKLTPQTTWVTKKLISFDLINGKWVKVIHGSI